MSWREISARERVAAFNITSSGSIAPLAAGQSDWFYVTANTSAVGSNSETFTFSPTDVNASGYSAGLADDTLTLTDTVEAPATAQVDTPSEITLPNVRVGTQDEQALSITNATSAPAAGLDASIFMINNAIGSGTITDLGAGATDNTDIQIGVATTTAGQKKGDVTVDLKSDAGNGNVSFLPNQYIEIFGAVYRPGSASIPAIIAHVGDPTSQALRITNSDPTDGYSEDLTATVVGSAGGVTISGSTTGDIAPQQTSSAISIGYSTTSVGSDGTVTLDFTTDGTGVDGLGTQDLGDQMFSVTVDNYAQAAFAQISGGGTLTSHGNALTLNLGDISAGNDPVTLRFGVVNGAAGPADLLSGTFSISGGSAFTNSGFAAFSAIGAGQINSSLMVSLDPSKDGSLSETITLDPIDYNSAGYSSALAPETLTISAVVSGLFVKSSSHSQPAANLKAGETLSITLDMNEPVAVSGTPGLMLSNDRDATYVAQRRSPAPALWSSTTRSARP